MNRRELLKSLVAAPALENSDVPSCRIKELERRVSHLTEWLCRLAASHLAISEILYEHGLVAEEYDQKYDSYLSEINDRVPSEDRTLKP